MNQIENPQISIDHTKHEIPNKLQLHTLSLREHNTYKSTLTGYLSQPSQDGLDSLADLFQEEIRHIAALVAENFGLEKHLGQFVSTANTTFLEYVDELCRNSELATNPKVLYNLRKAIMDAVVQEVEDEAGFYDKHKLTDDLKPEHPDAKEARQLLEILGNYPTGGTPVENLRYLEDTLDSMEDWTKEVFFIRFGPLIDAYKQGIVLIGNPTVPWREIEKLVPFSDSTATRLVEDAMRFLRNDPGLNRWRKGQSISN